MKNIVGKPVYGENFLFRGNNVQKAIRLMENENSFLLLGIRACLKFHQSATSGKFCPELR